MTQSDLPNDTKAPDPAGVDAGPQGGAGGVGGEPTGATLQADATQHTQAEPRQRPPHDRAEAQPEYRARPAGQSGVGTQADHASPIEEPLGDGNFQTTDQGPRPLRNG